MNVRQGLRLDKEKTRFSQLYEIFQRQIFSGKLPYGSRLPSARQIAENYGIGMRTVRAVLRALNDGGLIQLSERRRAVVVYQLPPLKDNLNVAKTILSRKWEILDIFQTIEVLFPDILVFCAKLSHIIDLEHYDPVVRWVRYNRDTTGRWKAASFFIHELLQASGNPLPGSLYAALNLSTSNVLLVEYKYDVLRDWPKMEKQDFARVLSALRNGNSLAIRKSFQAFFHTGFASMSGILDHLAAQFPGVPLDSKQHFVWHVAPIQYHFYQHIARDIVEKIGVGVYPQDSFLPPLHVLADEYRVSFHTVRRALLHLRDLGIVRLINGRGTQVLTQNVYERIKNESKIPVMLYLNAVQLMTLMIRPAASLAFDALDEAALLSLRRGLEEPHAVPLALLMHFVTEYVPLQTLQTVLRETQNILKWGFYFYRFYKKGAAYTNVLALKAFSCLEKGRRQAFADLLFECYRFILTRAREALIAEGYTQAAQVITPK